MLTMCVLSAPADEISPEMLVESDYSGPTESIGASTNPLIPHLYSGEEHGYDENDFHASTGHKNSEGLDVNLGNVPLPPSPRDCILPSGILIIFIIKVKNIHWGGVGKRKGGGRGGEGGGSAQWGR